MTALQGLGLLIAGAFCAGPLWYRLAVRDEKRIRDELRRLHRAEMNDLERRANAALDAIALETALAYAAADFAEWETEMREVSE
jgi:hypothetical protein